jgi:hypothetical protein
MIQNKTVQAGAGYGHGKMDGTVDFCPASLIKLDIML